MTARKRAEQPEPVEGVEVEGPGVEPTTREVDPDGPTDEPTTPDDDVEPIVDGSPVSSAARHNARYGDVDADAT